MISKKNVFFIAIATVISGCGTASISTRLPDNKDVSIAKQDLNQKNQEYQRNDLQELREMLSSVPNPVPLIKQEEPRFSVSFKNLNINAAYQSVVANSSLNVIIPSDIKENITLNLKEVTLIEALEAIRDIYGYEFEIKGKKILVSKPVLQNKLFQIDYLLGARNGKSEIKVSAGGVVDSSQQNSNQNAQGNVSGVPNNGKQTDGSKVTTTIQNDFWVVLDSVLKSIVGNKEGQEVVINPQSGIVYVKALPSQLRDVETYLNKTQAKVSRQVVLEAKIIEVTLSNGSQSGINWSAFDSNGNHKYSMGANPSILSTQGGLANPSSLGGAGGLLNNFSSGPLSLAFTGTSFSALMNFIQSQGDAQVLSAPRVATLNNQNAVLKVGTDEFHVTNVTTTSTSNGNSTTNTPSINVQPFFSGIALDVTPQIDDNGYVMLHVHPSISNVTDKDKVVNLGGMGTFTLPLATSAINESDTIVRVMDGDIVAIGGLMSSSLYRDGQKVPLIGDVPVAGELFKQHNDTYKKTELVILIKPTVINRSSDWDSMKQGFGGGK